jgi:hypothetical protein
MEFATMAFLNRFQWAIAFGARARQLAYESPTKTTTTSTAQQNESSITGQSCYQDQATQTSDAGTNDSPCAFCGQNEQPDEPPQDQLAEESSTGQISDCGESDEAVDEQSVREDMYVRILDEAEDDYTAGPSRLVLAPDGIRDDCPALLVTLELSGLVQQAIYAERRYAQAERLELDQGFQLMNLESAVSREIRAHEYHLERDGSDESASSKHSTAADKELENLRLMLENIEQRKRTAAAQLTTEAMYLHDCHKALAACLEESFTVAELVQPEEENEPGEVALLDLQEEYHAFCQQLREMEEGSQASSVAALDVKGNTYLLAPEQVFTPEEKLQAELKINLFAARKRLEDANHEFQKREVTRQLEQQTTDEDKQSFDVRWVQRISNITRELIDAEEALSTARAAALDGGLRLVTEYQTSGFGDEDDDGYRMSLENDWIVTAQSSNINEWVNQINEKTPSEVDSIPDTDEWDAKSVEGHDSGSVVDYGSDRKRIDAWQQDCHLLRSSAS